MKAIITRGLCIFMLAAIGWAQTQSAQRSTAAPSPVVVLQADYKEMAYQAENLTAQELLSLRDKALAGDMRTAALLGMAYQLGCPGAKQDAQEALRWYYLAADKGSSIAANQIAVYFDPAEGFAGNHGHDPEQALKWYRKAAERSDDAVALYNVGTMLLQMKRDAEAADWFRQAMEKDTPVASIAAGYLAELYEEGKALPGKSKQENRKEAVELFQRLATEDNAGAQFVMAEAYESRYFGVDRNAAESLKWLHKAADHQVPAAEFTLGDAYFHGRRGAEKDKAEGIKWLLKAADHGNAAAALSLALIYEEGDGVPKDFVAAYMWYHLAAEGWAEGTRLPPHPRPWGWRPVVLRHHFTDAEREEGKNRMQAWKMEHGRTQ